MPLTPGSRLGPYDVQTLLGTGGMGEVYKARDTRLDRSVAIKVLPEVLSADAQFRERFEREARTISQLNHPHICTLHDVGQQDGVDYLVFEYLEGETLADGLKKGPLPIEQALTIATGICDALDQAHRRGVVHRDLKPGNVMLVRGGGSTDSVVAKLLDFGLAKTTAPALSVSGSSIAPTQQAPLTQAGTILGTFQYMAPEQLEGREADARTDIFAFGAMLYEMVTGKKAFEGKTHISLVSAIMTADPAPMSALQPMSPRRLERIVRTCLAKDPDERWSSAHDLLLELKWLREGGESAAVGAPVPASARPRLSWLAVAALVSLAIGASAAWFLKPAPAVRAPLARFSIPLPAGQGFTRTGRHVVALSPDGTRLVYAANNQLYLRTINQPTPVPIRGSEIDPAEPFFSPDGEWVAFWAGGQLRKISVSGGAPVTLATIPNPFGGNWAPEGIVVGQGAAGVVRVPPDGGTAETVTKVDAAKPESAHGPQVLPGGRVLLFTLRASRGTWDDGVAVVQDLKGGERKVVFQGGRDFRYLSTGHLVYGRQATVFAVPFDLSSLEVKGGPVPLVENVASAGGGSGAMQWSVSETGSVAHVIGGEVQQRTLVWLDRNGNARPVTETRREFEDLALSPDGQSIAVTLETSPRSIWIQDVTRGTLSRLTFGADRRDPVWTPDGKRVIYGSADNLGLFWKPADGSGEEETLTTTKSIAFPHSVSPDGQWLVYAEGDDLRMLPLRGERKPITVVQSPATEGAGMVSADGRWLAYTSNESGRTEVYVRPFPGPGGKWQISTDGGHDPMWHPRGTELFFRNADQVLAVAISTSPTVKAGVPHVLFRGRFVNTGIDSGYTADHDRFVFIQESTQTSTPEIGFVLNWFQELTQRVKPTR
ncbi:MAG: serine/threonine-protein kinase [Acidobacteria bacterium]|nr:serine/threonine-protein kinase [Acidobacteriota bacterium]